MTDRAKFISGVTASLGHSEVQTPSPDSATAIFESDETAKLKADQAMAVATGRSVELIEQMAESATAAGWHVHRVANPEDAAELIADICQKHDARSVLRSAHDVLTDIPLDVAIRDTGASIGVAESTHSTGSVGSADQSEREKAKKAVFSADVGITGVDYAIAETGTVVLHPRKGLSRLVSLAPPIHIAVLRPGEVLESLDELFAVERDDFLSGKLSGSLNLISGPSKTGDIEGTIVTGIHGPLEVHLLILDSS
ncbi:MAG: lactate utilization protein [Chloroflexi bacterium]|nr:lactate utilization protein [Chloroflexota bacterium]